MVAVPHNAAFAQDIRRFDDRISVVASHGDQTDGQPPLSENLRYWYVIEPAALQPRDDVTFWDYFVM